VADTKITVEPASISIKDDRIQKLMSFLGNDNDLSPMESFRVVFNSPYWMIKYVMIDGRIYRQDIEIFPDGDYSADLSQITGRWLASGTARRVETRNICVSLIKDGMTKFIVTWTY
jgi:hypothetical protein